MNDAAKRIPNAEQIRAWNDYDAKHWVKKENHYNLASRNHYIHLLNALNIKPTDRILDIGCGTGESTLDAARLAPLGSALGVDLSDGMIKHAEKHAQAQKLLNVKFIVADAQVHPFSKNHFDLIISRTGSMFFEDPLKAFKNICRALKPGGRLLLLTWQGLEKNDWIKANFDAVSSIIQLSTPPSTSPGMFRLSNPNEVRLLLSKAGFSNIKFSSIEEQLNYGSNFEQAFDFVSSLGLFTSILKGKPTPKRETVFKKLEQILKHHDTGAGIMFNSATWLIQAKRKKS